MRRAKEAGLNGVAVRAGGVIVLDIAATARAADEAGVFFYGWDPAADAPAAADIEARPAAEAGA